MTHVTWEDKVTKVRHISDTVYTIETVLDYQNMSMYACKLLGKVRTL